MAAIVELSTAAIIVLELALPLRAADSITSMVAAGDSIVQYLTNGAVQRGCLCCTSCPFGERTLCRVAKADMMFEIRASVPECAGCQVSCQASVCGMA